VYEEDARASGRLTAERGGDLGSLRAEWAALAERSGNLFATWEWADVWWRHYGDGKRQLLLTCGAPDGRLTAIVPLVLDRERPVRVARFIGHGAADELGPICAPEEAPAAMAAIAAARLSAADRWHVLLAERLPGAHPWPSLLRGAELQRDSSPDVDIAGLDWDAYLATRSSNFRSQVRRKERKLQRERDLTYRLSDDPARLDADMETLFRLHRARWGEEASGAFDERREAFHGEFARVALERGWLRLWMAESEGRTVAAWYGFRFGGAEWYYQFGRDPEWDRYSVGLVLLAHTLREAANDGLDRYRLLRGGEGYKDRFATGDPGIVTVAVPRGVPGRVAVAGARAALRLPGRARKLAVGRLG
jgi:CelD/BcsL family acetyltransferase involved in cellulose biosynthesis